MELTWIPIETDEQIQHLAKIANEVWHEYFIRILTLEQIDYMINKFQSVSGMTDQIKNHGYQYFFIHWNNLDIGYTGICPDEKEKTLFLSKLYIKKEYRGLGYASNTFKFLENLCKKRSLHLMQLTVNRFNYDTIAIYEKKGFHTVRTQITDIGNGFVMDDFVMEKWVLSNIS